MTARSLVAATLLLQSAAGAARADGIKVVRGGPPTGFDRDQLVSTVGYIAPVLAVCWRRPTPAVTVELDVDASGAVAAARAMSKGPAAQCIAGVLAVQDLPATSAAYHVQLRIPAPAATPDDRAAIDQDMRSQRDALDACYAGAQSHAAGRVVLRFIVMPDGSLDAADVAESTLGDQAVETCLRETLPKLHVRARPGRKTFEFSLALDYGGAAGVAQPGAAAADPLSPQKDGPLEASDIQPVIGRAKASIQACYEREAKKRRDLAGLVVIRFTVREDGTLRNVQVKQSTLGSPAAEQCMVAVVAKLRFSSAKGRGETRVIYPLSFRAAK